MLTIIYKISDGVIVESRFDGSDVVSSTEQLLNAYARGNNCSTSDYACVEFPVERKDEIKPQRTIYIPSTASVAPNPNFVAEVPPPPAE